MNAHNLTLKEHFSVFGNRVTFWKKFRQTKLAGLTITSLLFFGTGMQAEQSKQGFYFGANLGVTANIDGETFDILGVATVVDVDLEYGYAVSGAIGYNYGNGWRVEGELAHAQANVDAIGTSIVTAELGEVRSTGLMINAYYDFRQGRKLQPYVGFGLGAMQSSYEGTRFSLVSGNVEFNEGSTNPAGQLMLGLGYWVNDRVLLSLEYRYVTTLDDATYGLSNGVLVEQEFDLHRLTVGMRYTF